MNKTKTLIIGSKWLTRGKHPRECVIVDILKTYNSKNELVKTEYVSTHEFMGQTLTHIDCGTTVIMGYIKKYGAAEAEMAL